MGDVPGARVKTFDSETLAALEVPVSFDWNDVDGVSYTTTDLNQHIPVYCGTLTARRGTVGKGGSGGTADLFVRDSL